MKAALCFIISYDHILNKEELWREWIHANKDIINVYFYYKDFNKIKSQWIREHTIPPKYIKKTNYFHIIPAYLSLIHFASLHDQKNRWFCMLTDACCPIVSPTKFRCLFNNNYDKSIMNWKKSWWNINVHKRANLSRLPNEFHLANDPWFILKREHVYLILHFVNKQKEMTEIICNGGLANESLFAIILQYYGQLKNTSQVVPAVTHLADWYRMSTATSPHVFRDADEKDVTFIETEQEKNACAVFIRKIAPEFPNSVLRHYIYTKNINNDYKLIFRENIIFLFNLFLTFLVFYFVWKALDYSKTYM